MKVILLLMLNLIIPLYILIGFIYYEMKISSLRKSCGQGVALFSGGLMSAGSRLYHGTFLAYIIIMSILWIVSFIGWTDVIHSLYFKNTYVLILLFLTFSSTLNVYVGSEGMVVGNKVYGHLQLKNFEVNMSDPNNPHTPLYPKVSFHFKDQKNPKISYVAKKDVDTIKLILGRSKNLG